MALPRLPLAQIERKEQRSASHRTTGRRPRNVTDLDLDEAAQRTWPISARTHGRDLERDFGETTWPISTRPCRAPMSARTLPVFLNHTGWGPNGSPSAMRRQAGLGVAGIVRQKASATPRGKMGSRIVLASTVGRRAVWAVGKKGSPRSPRAPAADPYRWLAEEPPEVLAEDDQGSRRPSKSGALPIADIAPPKPGSAPPVGSRPGSARPTSAAAGSFTVGGARASSSQAVPDSHGQRSPRQKMLSRACTLQFPAKYAPCDDPTADPSRHKKRFCSMESHRVSMMWFGARNQALELFPQGAEPSSKTESGSAALPAARGPAAIAETPAAAPRQGTDAGKPAGKLAAEQVCKALARELEACHDEGEVDKLLRLVRKVTTSTSSDTFSTCGAQAYRLREALRPLRESSVGAALGYSHRLWVTKAIEKQAQRRRQQIASGRADKADSQGRVGGLLSKVREERSSKITWRLRVSRVDWAMEGEEAESRRDGDDTAVQLPAGAVGERRAGSPSPAGRASPSLRGPPRRGSADTPSQSGESPGRGVVPQQRRPSLHRRQTRLLRKDSRFNDTRRRSSNMSDLVSEFVLEGEEFSGFEASKWALHNRFGIGSLKGVEAYRIWKKVFEVLKVDGEVHHTDLGRALEMAGFQKPDQECIDAAKLKVTQWSTLSAAQFNEFAIHFGTEMEKLQDRMFVIFDADNSGQIDRGELEGLLEHFGIIPMRHVLDEVLREVDEDHSGNVGLDEFRKAFEILRLREGFSAQEFQDLTDLFKKLDLDGSGEMDRREVTVVLGYLDYRLDADERDTIMEEVDTDGSGELSEFEFLLFMRRCRQIEMRKLTDAFNNVDPEADGLICFSQLLRAFAKLGYDPDPDATWEAAEAVGISSREASLDTSDFWQVLTECREREWFGTAELEQISAAFDLVDPEGHGEIEIAQIDRALLAVGLSLRSDLLLYLVGKVDLDCSGLLSQMEFRKLIRIYQIGQAQVVLATFEEFLDPDSFKLSISDSWKAFSTLGFVTDCVNDTNRVRAMGNLDLKAFVKEVKIFEQEQQLFRQKNSGFSEQACRDLAKRFEQFDTDNSGALESRELVALIEELLPGVATAPENRPKLMKMMEEAEGRSGILTESDKLAYRVAGVRSQRSSALPSATRINSSHQTELNFHQFLKLLSLVRVFKLDQIVQKEERVIEDCDLSILEVQQFRELFLENASGDGCMTMNDLLLIIGNVCPLGDKNKAELHEHMREVVSCTSRGQDLTITFAELMMLMGRLRDANFGGIRDKFFS